MMATNFPSSLDSLTNPTASDKLNSVTVPHATQHANVNDAVEALEAKVGVDGSAVVTSLDYKVAALEAGGTANAIVAYADSAARATAVPSPTEGDLSYLQDTNTVEVYDGSAWVSVGGATMIKKVEAFTATGTWTVPAGVTYAIAHVRGGGGGNNGGSSKGTNGGSSSVAFSGGTVTAAGGPGHATSGQTVSVAYANAAANSGEGGAAASSGTAYSAASTAPSGAYVVAGDTVTPAASITVTVGAGGTGNANGGSGYVWIEYYEEA